MDYIDEIFKKTKYMESLVDEIKSNQISLNDKSNNLLKEFHLSNGKVIQAARMIMRAWVNYKINKKFYVLLTEFREKELAKKIEKIVLHRETIIEDKKEIDYDIEIARKAIEILSAKIIPKNKILCEPFMTKRNLYPTLSMRNNRTNYLANIMNFLQYADGKNDLWDISALININKKKTLKLFNKLKKQNLISS
jgi:hypothetical protein